MTQLNRMTSFLLLLLVPGGEKARGDGRDERTPNVTEFR